MNRFVDAHAPRGRVASRAPRRAPLEPAPLPNRLRHVRVRAPCPRLNTPRNAPRLKDCRRPPDRPPQSQPTFVAGRRRTESDSFTKRANMCADHARTLDACGVATPYRRKRKLAPTAAVLARAQASYRSGFRGAYAPHRSGAMPPCRPSTAKSSASRIDPHDAPDPLTVRAVVSPVLRVVPVSPTPLMAAGQSEPRGLGHAWRLVGTGVDLL